MRNSSQELGATLPMRITALVPSRSPHLTRLPISVALPKATLLGTPSTNSKMLLSPWQTHLAVSSQEIWAPVGDPEIGLPEVEPDLAG